jgi:hypothetical protein
MAPRLHRFLFCVILACAGLPAGALAAELGDARVVSHIGQQLVAEIELTALHDEAATVQVRLASADIYRGAGIAMPPVLSGLNLSVVRRGGRQFLTVTSLAPVQSDYLHLYLELADGNERGVRLATLWLTPDPNLAPKPGPEPKTAPKPEPATAPERKAAPEPKPSTASATRPAVPSVPQPVLKPAPATAAPAAQATPVPASKPTAAVARAPVPAAKVAPPAAPAPLTLSAAKPASCPRPDPAVLKTCVALDYKNAQLNAHIGQLEDKVKVLQIAMGAVPASRHVVSAKAGTHAERLRYVATEKAAARAVAPVAKPKKAPPSEPAFPWLWLALGGAVLLAGAGAGVFVLRRKAAREREAKARTASLPPTMPGVKKRLMPDNSAAAGAGAAADTTQE